MASVPLGLQQRAHFPDSEFASLCNHRGQLLKTSFSHSLSPHHCTDALILFFRGTRPNTTHNTFPLQIQCPQGIGLSFQMSTKLYCFLCNASVILIYGHSCQILPKYNSSGLCHLLTQLPISHDVTHNILCYHVSDATSLPLPRS